MDNNFTNIINFLKNNSFEYIKNNFFEIIKENEKCIEYNNDDITILGEGMHGRVFSPNDFFEYKGNKYPLVIKENVNKNSEKIEFTNDKNKNFILGNGNLTTELIILSYLNNLNSPNLPKIFGYCSKKYVKKIISYRFGMDNKIEIDLSGKILLKKEMEEQIYKKNLNTITGLASYIYYKREGDLITFPNKIKCNVIELFDYLTISYLATYHKLVINNVYPKDLHTGNFFIHWLNKDSYFQNENIEKLEYITYKIGDKMYRIKTYGFLLIFGDVGNYNIKFNDNLYLVGQSNYINKNFDVHFNIFSDSFEVFSFIRALSNFLSDSDLEKTVLIDILNSTPYNDRPNKIYNLQGEKLNYINKLKNPEELLKVFYKKYGVKSFSKSKNDILI